MKSKFNLNIIFLIVSLTCLSQCTSDPAHPSWETDNLAPILKTSLSMDDFISDTLLHVSSDGQMTLLYTYDLYNLTFDTLLNVPDILTDNSWKLVTYYPAPPGYILFNTPSSEKRLKLSNVQLTKIKIKSGTIDLKVSNTIARKVLFNYQINSATLNNNPFNVSFSIPAATANNEGVFSQSYDASGYIFDLRGTTNNNYNTIISSAKAQIDPLAESILLTPKDSTVTYSKLNNIHISEARGYFGNDKINIGPRSTNFDFFKSILEGTLGLENVKLKFEITNGIGLDAQLIIKQFSSINNKTKKQVLLKGSMVNSPINITRAKETGNSNNPLIPTTRTIDFSTTNFKELIENLPTQIVYQMQIITNPIGNISSGNDFLFENSVLKASLTMEIPLSGKATNIAFSKTIPVDFKTSKTNNIKEASLILEINNGFPFDGIVQLYMLNNQNVIIDSIFPQSYIASAIVDRTKKVLEKKLNVFQIPLNNQRISNLNNTTSIIVKAKINTPSTDNYIRIYKDYNIDINLKGSFKYLINTKKK